MILAIDDWRFEVDITATMEYSAKEAAEHCDCAYCRNFYAAVDSTYPELRPFLAQFGVDIEAPDELLPYDFPQKMQYYGYYAVCGRIHQTGKKPIMVSGTGIRPDRFSDLHINSGCQEPYFFLNVSGINLPWVLDEPMEDVISPANEPSFLKKMWERLLGKNKKNIPYS